MRNLVARIVLILLFAPILLQAQKDFPIKLGLRVAPAISWLNPSTEGYESEGVRFGISAGLVTDFYFADNYAVSTGFSFLFPSGRLSYGDLLTIQGTQDTGVIDRIYNFYYLEIPLMIKMKTNQFGKFSFYGQIGFGTAFRLKATAKNYVTLEDGTTGETENEITNKTTLMRESVLAGIGLEFEIDKSTRLFGGVNYSNALNNVLTGKNLLTNEDAKGVSSFVELNIGVLF